MVNTVDDPASGVIVYRRLRAPRRHGEALIDPPFRAATETIRQNAARLADKSVQLHGRSVADLAHSGRRELLEAARSYTSSYLNHSDVVGATADGELPLLLTGHQPELFHPGVWFKNFTLDALARHVGAIPINLIVDNDLPRSTSVLCPLIDASHARATPVAFDRAGHYVPYEERAILDSEQFHSFASRLACSIEPLVPDPLVRSFWPLAMEAAQRTNRLGLALAQSRHQWEQQWGLQTLEVPWSRVCDTPTFHWFTAHLLSELPRLHRDYNNALLEYRRIHRLRSRTHPVADLEQVDDSLEAPFWIWSDQDSTRRRLFVRRHQGCLELTDRRKTRVCLPLGGENLANTVEALQTLRGSGIKIRSRALITTMYTRLVLGDLFLHGIGGAKYDQLTDELIRRFIGMRPPDFMTVTATVMLPIERENVETEDLRRTHQQLRELDFHPEKHAPQDAAVQRLAEEKWSWIRAELPPNRRAERHEAITRVNELLQSWVQPVREKLLLEREEFIDRLRRARITNSREYPFCLFPEKTLPHILLDILQKHL